MATDCTTDSFATSSTLAFGKDHLHIDGPYTEFATTDGPDNTARTLIDQTVNWTHPGPDDVLAHVLFMRPPRYVRSQGPRQHYIDEEWDITTNGAAPSLSGAVDARFGGGVTRNQTNYFWVNLESPQTYMPHGVSQVVRTTGQQIRIRYQARLAVSSAGGTNMDVRSYWHAIYIVTSPLPIL